MQWVGGFEQATEPRSERVETEQVPPCMTGPPGEVTRGDTAHKLACSLRFTRVIQPDVMRGRSTRPRPGREDAGMGSDSGIAGAGTSGTVESTPDSQVDGLSPLQRIVAGLVALATMTLGGIAVFQSANEAGTLALLLLGGVFSYLAVSGQALLRLRVAGGEAEFTKAVTRGVLKTAEGSVPTAGGGRTAEDVAVRILLDAAQESPTVPRQVLAITEAYQYEQAVAAALRRVSQNVNMSNGSMDSGVDAVVDGAVNVQVKYVRSGAGLILMRDVAGRDYAAAVGTGRKGVLYVTNVRNYRLDAPSQVESEHMPAMKVIHWTPEMDDDVLRQALSDLQAPEA